MTTNKTLIKSTGIIGFATALSRVLGFFRDILFAKYFGTNIFAQAFVVAFRLPNMLRDMVGEGATDAAIVPVLTEYQHTRTQEEYWEAARVILNLMLTVLITLSVIGIISAPLFVRIMAPGFLEDPAKFNLTVFLTRLMFPYILLVGIVAYSKGVLNSFHYFTTPAFSSVVLNVTMILTLLFLCPVIGVKGMVAGVLIGGTLEVLIQIPPLKRYGFKFERGFRLIHPVATRIGKLLMPRVLGSGVYQLGVLIDTVLASLAWIVGAGGVAALYYSTRLVQLPLAIFAVALATAALPRMTREVASKDMAKFRGTIAFSLKFVFVIMLPATVGLMVLAEPIVRILLQRGEFTAYSTAITANTLFFYTIGLFAYSGVKILVGAYYSMGDTRTTVKTAAIALLVNFLLNLILMWPLKVGGLALSTSIAAITNFVMLYTRLSKKIGDIGTKVIVDSVGRVASATAIMAVFISLSNMFILREGILAGAGKFVALFGVIAGAGAIYFISAYFLKVDEVTRLVSLVASRLRGRVTHDE